MENIKKNDPIKIFGIKISIVQDEQYICYIGLRTY